MYKRQVIPGERQSAIFGVIRPIMILPDAVLEEKTVAYMIQHEIKHYANYDLWLKFLVDLLVVIHWWNPIVYMMRKELSLAFELSNDYMVTKMCIRDRIWTKRRTKRSEGNAKLRLDIYRAYVTIRKYSNINILIKSNDRVSRELFSTREGRSMG